MPLNPGTHLGPYEIAGPLGSGGMGEVYRARDTRLERTVAIKILPRELSNDPIRKQRFEREAKTISSLNHPHICVLHDVGSQDGIDYLVMECVTAYADHNFRIDHSEVGATLLREGKPGTDTKLRQTPLFRSAAIYRQVSLYKGWQLKQR